MNFEKLGKVTFSVPQQVRNDWYSWQAYIDLSDKIRGVYILRGHNEEVLYVGSSSKLKNRLSTHLYKSPFKEEIQSIDYIVCGKDGAWLDRYELEKILYYLLKPKYSKKKINPQHYYKIKRIKN